MTASFQLLDSLAAFDDVRWHLLSAYTTDGLSEEEHVGYAQAVAYDMVAAYWKACVRDDDAKWEMSIVRFSDGIRLHPDVVQNARTAGAVAALLKPVEAAYRLGSLYAALLPVKYRSLISFLRRASLHHANYVTGIGKIVCASVRS